MLKVADMLAVFAAQVERLKPCLCGDDPREIDCIGPNVNAGFFCRLIDTLQLHRCKLCGTSWLLLPAHIEGGGWTLLDKYQRPGRCCDNAEMGMQIEFLRNLPAYPSPAVLAAAEARGRREALTDGLEKPTHYEDQHGNWRPFSTALDAQPSPAPAPPPEVISGPLHPTVLARGRVLAAISTEVPMSEEEAALDVDYDRATPAPSEARVREALEKLADKLDAMEAPVNGCIGVSAAHGFFYKGPNWAQELKAARAALRLPAPAAAPVEPTCGVCDTHNIRTVLTGGNNVCEDCYGGLVQDYEALMVRLPAFRLEQIECMCGPEGKCAKHEVPPPAPQTPEEPR
jgi:hypothetical protein